MAINVETLAAAKKYADKIAGSSGATGGGDKPLTGSNPPTNTTVGKLGQEYIQESLGLVYKCVRIANGQYEWKEVAYTEDVIAIIDESIEEAITNALTTPV